MILFELTGSETNTVYQEMAVANGLRQYDFLKSVVEASVAIGRPFLSQAVIKALNFHAITCLHTNAGEYRPCPVIVGKHQPPEHYRVQALMDDFVNVVNRNWEATDPVVLAAFVLWQLNFIHPFINGNGRTARAACYFVLCLKTGHWLPGQTILPELIKQNRVEYVTALEHADTSARATGQADLAPLHALLTRLIDEQLQSHQPAGEDAPAKADEKPAHWLDQDLPMGRRIGIDRRPLDHLALPRWPGLVAGHSLWSRHHLHGLLWRLDKDRTTELVEEETRNLAAMIQGRVQQIMVAANEVAAFDSISSMFAAGTDERIKDAMRKIKHCWLTFKPFRPYAGLGEFSAVSALGDVERHCRELI
ncbi:Fic family protein [Luteibacter sp.]|uniref:Fic family protein n=1 Tax=Luteibacter sp. TaxID=1886636 RepID=UPI002806E64D|nr:Fic family protein [Luteibacter sp.]MDQ8050864.1 Fic family protein [Luteibacter sp.]